MKIQNVIVIAALFLVAQAVNAGQVTGLTTFTAGTPAKAAEVNGNFTAVQSAVNDNDTRLTTVEVSVAAGNVKGALLTQMAGNATFPADPTDSSGYFGYYAMAPVVSNALSNYTPTVNAIAFATTRCSFQGNAAGQFLEQHAALRSPAGSSGTVTTGTQFAMGSTIPGANVRVQDSNFDYFTLTANTSYDFGVNFTTQTPFGAATVNPGFCSVVVMVFRQ